MNSEKKPLTREDERCSDGPLQEEVFAVLKNSPSHLPIPPADA
jgi:hypothetical protein